MVDRVDIELQQPFSHHRYLGYQGADLFNAATVQQGHDAGLITYFVKPMRKDTFFDQTPPFFLYTLTCSVETVFVPPF
jgi:hypothetical protein